MNDLVDGEVKRVCMNSWLEIEEMKREQEEKREQEKEQQKEKFIRDLIGQLVDSEIRQSLDRMTRDEVLYKWKAGRRKIMITLAEESATAMVNEEMVKMTEQIMTTVRDSVANSVEKRLLLVAILVPNLVTILVTFVCSVPQKKCHLVTI